MDRSALHRLSIAVLFATLVAVPAVHAQVVVKANDTVNFKFGILMQPQFDELQDATTKGYAQNLFIRRARLLFAGQVAPNVSFFVETDTPNLGKTVSNAKNIQPSTYLQDAYVEYKVRDELMFDAGLMLISSSRNGLQSAASLLPIDYSPYTFNQSAATQGTAGRDTGVLARGYLLDKHFEYRVGVEQGARDAASRNSLRTNVRVQYDFLDPQAGPFFYTGTYLGKKKVFAVGGGYDQQRDYKTYAVDAFFDHPIGGGAVTAQADLAHFDGGTFLKALPKQSDLLFEAGYLIPATRFEPVVQYVKKDVSNTDAGDESRVSAGLNYWIAGHNANLKGAFSRIDKKGAPRKANEFTVQFQIFYF